MSRKIPGAPPGVIVHTRALFSVADKTGIGPLAWVVSGGGALIVATEQTRTALVQSSVPVNRVVFIDHDESQAPIKLLDYKTHYGLHMERTPGETAKTEKSGVPMYDLVVAWPHTLRDLRQELSRQYEQLDFWSMLRFIDVSTVALLVNAARNPWNIAVVSHHSDYAEVVAEIEQYGGTTLALRRVLAQRALLRMAEYVQSVGFGFDAPDLPLERPFLGR